MLKGFLHAAIVVSVAGSAVSALASEVMVLKQVWLGADGKPVRSASDGVGKNVLNRVLCVDGLKVFQSSFYDSRGGITMIQLYEEKNGNIVPARCMVEGRLD